MSSRDIDDLADRRRARWRREMSAKLHDAATEALRESSLNELTLHMLAQRANLAEERAADMFDSIDDLIIEICMRRIGAVTVITDAADGSLARVGQQLSQLMIMVAEEPAVARACTAVFLKGGPASNRARALIGVEIRRLVASSVGPGSWPEVATTLEMLVSGALIEAAAGVMTFQTAAQRLETAIGLVLESVPK